MYQNVVFVETPYKLERKFSRNTKSGRPIRINLSFKQGAAFINKENTYIVKNYFTTTEI